MICEPYKIKEVKHLPLLKAHERWSALKKANFNVLALDSDSVTFDLAPQGQSSWSHFQKAGFMIGDEAYAGSANYNRLTSVADKILGLPRLIPTHNRIGAEKLLVATLLKKGQLVCHNRGRVMSLVSFFGGNSLDVTQPEAKAFKRPNHFGANVDVSHLEKTLKSSGSEKVAYVHMVLCPDAWNSQPVSMANLKQVKALTVKFGIPFVLDISNVMENALWVAQAEETTSEIIEVAREIIALADVTIMDAAEDARADVGGFISCVNDDLFAKLRNQVVVYEGLHTYGGMTGRAMEVFAVGLEEVLSTDYIYWHDQQIENLYQLLVDNGVPVFRGTKSIGLDVSAFLPHLNQDDCPKFTLSACLFAIGGIRARIIEGAQYHLEGQGKLIHTLELPKNAYTQDHLKAIAHAVSLVYKNRQQILGLKLLTPETEFVDELRFEPRNNRLFVAFSDSKTAAGRVFEPYKVAIFEPIEKRDKPQRIQKISEAGYNTFLLDSKDVYIDLLTDSGTTAMSCYQWEGMTNSTDTAYSSKHYNALIDEFRDVLGFKHIIPTHQGRAAEYIMSQTMVTPGQWVPGNMYFTTTKLHQEMAGGVFCDVIVDEAHLAKSDYPWKGNIDTRKLENAINDAGGGQNVAYVSFEMSVNMAGGQPFSMQNAKEVSALCQAHGIPLMYDATRCIENARMIQAKDPDYAHSTVADILKEMMSYGDGCTISCKKDFMVNMGGLLACNNDVLAKKFERMLRITEGDLTTGGLDPKDLEALHRGLLDSLNDEYIASRVEQTQRLGYKLKKAGIPIVEPPGSHAIFVDAKAFLPHVDQDNYPAQALACAIYIETGVRAMERGNVSKGRNPKTGENYRPQLELVRLTIPRRVYSNSHFDFVVDGIKRLWECREKITGLDVVYEPEVLRFFQGRFKPVSNWDF